MNCELECNLQFKNLLYQSILLLVIFFFVIFSQLSHPLTSQLHIEIRLVWFIILIGEVGAAHGDGWLYLCSLVPLIEAGDGDDPGWSSKCRLPGSLVVETLPPGVSVLTVPGSDPGVDVARPNTRYEHQGVFVSKTCQRFPIFPTGAIGETIGSKVSVEAIKASCLDVCSMFQLHYEPDEDGVQLCGSDREISPS